MPSNNETFNGVNGTELSVFNSDWSKHPSYTVNSEILNNRLIQSATGTSAYTHTWTPAGPDQKGTMIIRAVANGNPHSGFVLRFSTSADTGYLFRYWGKAGTTAFQLYRINAGTYALLASSVQTLTAGNDYTIIGSVVTSGSQVDIELSVPEISGSPLISYADTSASRITVANKTGIRCNDNFSGTGYHIDNLLVEDIVGGTSFTGVAVRSESDNSGGVSGLVSGISNEVQHSFVDVNSFTPDLTVGFSQSAVRSDAGITNYLLPDVHAGYQGIGVRSEGDIADFTGSLIHGFNGLGARSDVDIQSFVADMALGINQEALRSNADIAGYVGFLDIYADIINARSAVVLRSASSNVSFKNNVAQFEPIKIDTFKNDTGFPVPLESHNSDIGGGWSGLQTEKFSINSLGKVYFEDNTGNGRTLGNENPVSANQIVTVHLGYEYNVAILVRFTTEISGYEIGTIHLSKNWYIRRIDAGVSTYLGGGYTPDPSYFDTNYFTAKIVDATITVYFNDQMLGSVEDPTHSEPGNIGIKIYYLYTEIDKIEAYTTNIIENINTLTTVSIDVLDEKVSVPQIITDVTIH